MEISLADSIAVAQAEEEAFRIRQQAKCGYYCDISCPNCGRHRVMVGTDGKHRCEKCCWCIEDDDYDAELMDYLM